MDEHRHELRPRSPARRGPRRRDGAPPPPESRDYNPPAEFLPPRPQRARLGIFGGSFNPVHNGHLFMAGHLLRAGLLDEVLFVPAGIPPHKPTAVLAPGPDRYAMLRAAIAPYPAFSASDIELQETERATYTFNTLDTLRHAFPERQILFVMGSDCLQELHTWYRATELVTLADFIIYPRPDAEPPALVELVERFGMKNAHKLRAAVLDAPLLPITASLVRQQRAAGRTLAGLVPPAVDEYLAQHRLYETRQPGVQHGSEAAADSARPD